MRPQLDPLMSHQRADWETPPDLFARLNGEFQFTLDAAANEKNHLCRVWHGPSGTFEDALTAPWDGRVWCNPPYGPMIPKFVDKALQSFDQQTTERIVLLLPARTDTKWFHRLVDSNVCSFRFIRGRLKFRLNGQPIMDKHNRPVGAPFPSLLVILGKSSMWLPSPVWSEL
jgi:phage N-6-adenine-methyltransferase